LRASVVGLAAAVLVLLGPGSATRLEAGWGRVLAPASGHRVVAGGLTHVRWSTLPPGTEEFELLLSVDGGQSYRLRLTPQLDPALGVYAWHVPNLPAPSAKLRLRVGIGGREVECTPSEAFTIVPIDTQPSALVEYRAGEWWPAPDSRPVTTAVVVPRPRLGLPKLHHRRRAQARLASRSAVPAPLLRAPRAAVIGAATTSVVGSPAVDRSPGSFPLRP
jgi:hypothetical protein